MNRKFWIIIVIFLLGFFLRSFNVLATPASLYWDEMSLGYNARSIVQTLKDEHGEFLPVSRFMAYGDYKPSGYIYAVALTIKLIGDSELAVRMPSVFAGSLLIIVTFLLTSEFFYKQGPSKKDKIALLSSFLIAISPWSIQMSRGAFEANLATLFSSLGIYLFIRSVRTTHLVTFIFSALFLALSMYTFNTHRVFVPLIMSGISLLFLKRIFSNKNLFFKTFIFGITLLLLIGPMIPHLLSSEGRLRFNEVSWSNDSSLVEISNERVARNGGNFITKIVNNRRVVYTLEFLKHYTDHFKPSYLFFTGDVNARLSSQAVGELYLVEALFLISGIYFLLRYKSQSSIIIFIWTVLGIIPAALARETPHALRTLNLLPIPQIIVAVGIFHISSLTFGKKKFLLALTISSIYIVSLFVYLHNYHLHYKKDSAMDWQYGYKEMVHYVSTIEKNYNHIVVTGKYGRPYIYFLYYLPYSPSKYWETRRAYLDQFGFWNIEGFDKYSFIESDKYPNKGKTLYIGDNSELPKKTKIIKTIYNLRQQPVFQIYEK